MALQIHTGLSVYMFKVEHKKNKFCIFWSFSVMAVRRSSSTQVSGSSTLQILSDENILMAQLKQFTQMEDRKRVIPAAACGLKTLKDVSSWIPRPSLTWSYLSNAGIVA